MYRIITWVPRSFVHNGTEYVNGGEIAVASLADALNVAEIIHSEGCGSVQIFENEKLILKSYMGDSGVKSGVYWV